MRLYERVGQFIRENHLHRTVWTGKVLEEKIREHKCKDKVLRSRNRQELASILKYLASNGMMEILPERVYQNQPGERGAKPAIQYRHRAGAKY